MNAKIIIGFLIIILIGAGVYFFSQTDNKQASLFSIDPTGQSTLNAQNSSFEIERVMVDLKNGLSQVEAAPGSASKITTKYFGNDAVGDLNGDGLQDVAFLVTHDGGGSGLFYYVVVLLKTSDSYKTTNTFFLGDRIAPQSTNIINGELHVNYAERRLDEPFTAQPSIGVTKFLKVTSDSKLIESAR